MVCNVVDRSSACVVLQHDTIKTKTMDRICNARLFRKTLLDREEYATKVEREMGEARRSNYIYMLIDELREKVHDCGSEGEEAMKAKKALDVAELEFDRHEGRMRYMTDKYVRMRVVACFRRSCVNECVYMCLDLCAL